MIHVLTGENSFMLQAELRHLLRTFIAEHGDMAVEQLDGEEVEFDRIREALQSLPFLANKKLVILRNPSANKTFTDEAEQLLKELPETTELIIAELKFDKRTSLYKFLKKSADLTEYNEMDIPQLASWLVKAATEQGGTISRRDAMYLVERVGANQQLLHSELTKLVQYQPEVIKATIDLLTERTPQSTIFDMLDAALSGNTERALELYREQRAMKEEPQKILAMLIWQLHVIALVKAAGNRTAEEIGKDANMKPYSLRKSQNIARHMTINRVKQLVDDALTLDIRLKSESLDADDALQNFIISL